MTREEAIALLNEQYETCKRIYDCSADQRNSYPNVPQFMEALGMALTALRPISGEQVEKVWGGCGWCDEEWGTCDPITNRFTMPPRGGIRFCPFCGKPQTDEAVDILLRRLEALHEADLI